MKELDPNRLLQIGMDARNANLKCLKFIKQERKEHEQHQLRDAGSCGLHTMHNEFKTGAEKTDWGMKKILKDFMIHQQEGTISSQSLV